MDRKCKCKCKCCLRNVEKAQTVVNIDYDRLADAIVRAETEVQNNQQKTGKYRGWAMKAINYILHWAICAVSLYSIYVAWTVCYPNETIPIYGCIIVSVLFALIGFYEVLCMFESSNDSSSEAMAHFNTNVSIFAFIVALIAFYMEVT